MTHPGSAPSGSAARTRRAAVGRVADVALEASVVGSFTRLGPAVRAPLLGWTDPAPLALAGRTAVVTGASSGIGAAVATGLARSGAEVHLVGRDEEALGRVAGQIGRVAPDAVTTTHAADLADLSAVRSLADRLVARHERLDVVAHVAGALLHDEVRTVDGLELTFQVHVVAPFLLTARLLDPLTAAGGRVLVMTSGGMYLRGLDLELLLHPPEPFDGTAAYARAKRAQVELVRAWAERHPDSPVGVHALHPGWVDTPGLRRSLPGFTRRLAPLLRSPEQGADTALWLATAADLDPPGGRLWHDRRPRPTRVVPGTGTDRRERDRLWRLVATRAGTGPDGEDR